MYFIFNINSVSKSSKGYFKELLIMEYYIRNVHEGIVVPMAQRTLFAVLRFVI